MLRNGYQARLATPFARYAKLADAGKFVAIGNSLSFDVFATGEEVKAKEKIVLIVARIDEDSKRITMALKVWRRVEKDGSGTDWKLFIVGSGDDERYCQRLARKWNLQNVVFTGRQDPIPYYRKASVFMMTSAHEGFPMTLGEAQQMGVVPIAFGSFAAVYDIIEHNHNGLIIPDKNIGEYAKQLKNLMLGSSKRQRLAENAIKSCQKLSIDTFIEKWVALFSHLK
jgi:glycosyltransferase involved in cell wall biosynthesis